MSLNVAVLVTYSTPSPPKASHLQNLEALSQSSWRHEALYMHSRSSTYGAKKLFEPYCGGKSPRLLSVSYQSLLVTLHGQLFLSQL